ncbi:MAG: EI24 domain-containing protein [Desulfarculus sp.]|nr:EI24 domain-containing protein [Desulfarculus sp.]
MSPWLTPGPLGGLGAPVKALGFLWAHKRLLPLAGVPFLINLGLFALIFWFSYSRFDAWVQGFLPLAEGWWWVLLYYLLAVLVVLLLLVVQVYLFALVGSVVAAPFLELLTRRVEEAAAPAAAAHWASAGFFREIMRVAGQALKKLMLYLLAMGLLLVLNLLPGLGAVLYAVLAFLTTCFFLTLEFVDYPLDRRGQSLSAKLAYVRRLGLRGLGFGAAVFVLGLVPVANLAFLPLSAVGGTLLYLDHPLPPPPPSRVESNV